MARALLLLLLALPLASAGAAETFRAVSYHDVRDVVLEDYDPDQYAISTANLSAHFRWLRDHGYTPVSVAQIRAAATGGPPLPAKPVLLTFDDGYRSHYTRVYPLLRAFGYPAVFSLVTEWMETPAGGEVLYGREPKPREAFLSWPEAREMAASGLAEFASHSHDLHKGLSANPQANELPAAVSRLHDEDGYESTEAYLARLSEDLGASVRIMRDRLGAAPDVMTWPYGKYNAESLDVARRHGLTVNLTLDDGRGSLADLGRIPRILIQANPGAAKLADALTLPKRPEILRAAHVDLDYVYDEDPAQQEENLGTLLDRVRALEISHVFLQAFADPDADGAAEAVYFPSRHMPVRADLFSRAAWQLKTRAEVSVYAWMPVLAFDPPGGAPGPRVMEALHSGTRVDPDSEPRLTPYSAANRQWIREVYEDLAVYANFDGLIFHDDARMNEYEDVSEPGLAALQEALGPEATASRLREDAALQSTWAAHNADRMSSFTTELAAHVRRWRPELKTARNVFADTLLTPGSERWLAQSLDDALVRYDYVALMAMPHLENRDDAWPFLADLARRAAQKPDAHKKLVFELQAVDWRRDRPIDAAVLADQMRALQAMGVRHLAWYPDDFIAGLPELETLRRGASLAEYPHRRR